MLLPMSTATAWHAHAASSYASAAQLALGPLLSVPSSIVQRLALPLSPPVKLVQYALAVANLAIALVAYAVVSFTTTVALLVTTRPCAAATVAAAFGVALVSPNLIAAWSRQRSRLSPVRLMGAAMTARRAVQAVVVASVGAVAGAAKGGATAVALWLVPPRLLRLIGASQWLALQRRHCSAPLTKPRLPRAVAVPIATAVATVAAVPVDVHEAVDPQLQAFAAPPAAPPADLTAAAAATAAAVASRINLGFAREMALLDEEAAAKEEAWMRKVPATPRPRPRPPGAVGPPLAWEDTTSAAAARINEGFEIEMRRDERETR